MKLDSQPLLIVGTQRSGSNLLRLMLNQLPEIDAPHPPHLMQIFAPLLPGYGDLNNHNNRVLLVSDIAAYVNANPVAWHGITLTVTDILPHLTTHTLADIFKVVYQLKALQKNARYWCCKSMANIYYIPEIEAEGWQHYYIHLLRDGRDVAASFQKSIVGEKHIYFLAQQWKKDQELSAQLLATTPADRIVQIRYEEFITNPKQALLPALNMLGLKWSDEILNYYLSDEAKRTAASGDMWRNVVKPVDAGNMRHYSEKLSTREIEIFECIAGDMLEHFGYSRDSQTRNCDFSETEIKQFSEENTALKAAAQQRYAVDARVRIPQQQLLEQIKKRNHN